MASRWWIKTSGTGSWTDTANWSATNGGAGGASVPGIGDTVYFNRGTSTVTGTPGTSLAAVYVTANVNLGTSSAALSLGTLSLFYYNSQGTSYLTATHPGTAGYLWQVFNAASLTFVASAFAGGVVYAFAGTVTIDASCTGVGVQCEGATVTIAYGATFTAGVVVYAGTVVNDSNIGAGGVNVYGGTCVTGETSVGTFAGITVVSGSYFHTSAATISSLIVYPLGRTVATGTSPFTVTSSEVHLGGTRFPNPPVTVTYTNPTVTPGQP